MKHLYCFLFTVMNLTLFSQTRPAEVFPAVFEEAFSLKEDQADSVISGAYSIIDAGNIKISSGKIIACNPVTSFQAKAFVQKFPVGIFPVQLATDEGSVAFSRIVFSDKKVEKWRFALLPGQKEVSLTDTTKFYCFGVDAGMAMFIDQVANKALVDKMMSLWSEVFIDRMEESKYTGFVHESGNHNFAVFSTGYGDGCYGTYIGYDKDGNPCRLLIDFALTEWWK